MKNKIDSVNIIPAGTNLKNIALDLKNYNEESRRYLAPKKLREKSIEELKRGILANRKMRELDKLKRDIAEGKKQRDLEMWIEETVGEINSGVVCPHGLNANFELVGDKKRRYICIEPYEVRDEVLRECLNCEYYLEPGRE